MIAINNPLQIKKRVIIIKGFIILGSIEGDDNLLILAGWWRVFHQSTENLIIGKLIEQTIINIAVILLKIKKMDLVNLNLMTIVFI